LGRRGARQKESERKEAREKGDHMRKVERKTSQRVLLSCEASWMLYIAERILCSYKKGVIDCDTRAVSRIRDKMR
jgi:hypothetical protein